MRLIDTIKKELIKLIRKSFDDGLDALYLYHPELAESVYKLGEQTCVIGNYETDGWTFNTGHALKQTLYVVGAEDCDLRKYVILITDRLANSHTIEKAIFLNKKDMLDCNIVVIGIGDRYDREFFEQTLKNKPATHIHLDHPSELLNAFLKEKTHGDEDVCSPPDERSE